MSSYLPRELILPTSCSTIIRCFEDVVAVGFELTMVLSNGSGDCGCHVGTTGGEESSWWLGEEDAGFELGGE